MNLLKVFSGNLNNLAAPVLKFLHMAVSLLAVQITYAYTSNIVFALYSFGLFLVGMHNALTYGRLAKIWEGSRLRRNDYLYGLLIAVFLGLASTKYLNNDRALVVSLALTFFLVYKYLERLCFNALVFTRNVYYAYLFAITTASIEVILFLSLFNLFNHYLARFIIPSLALIFLLAYLNAYIFRNSVHNKGFSKDAELKNKDMIFYTLYSFFLLGIVMIDRALALLNPNLFFLSGRYLLIFTYASAFYALLVSTIESQKPTLHEIAKSSEDLLSYLRSKPSRLINFLSIVSLLIGVILLAVSKILLFMQVNIWIISSSDLLIAGSLIIFFSLLFLLVHIQVFFLVTRSYFPLVLAWLVAILIRFHSFTMENIEAYLGTLVLCPCAMIAVFSLFINNKKKRGCKPANNGKY